MNTADISLFKKNVEEGLKKQHAQSTSSKPSSCYTGKRKSKRQIRWADILAIVAYGRGGGGNPSRDHNERSVLLILLLHKTPRAGSR
jgi:hypothetical protein